MFNLAVWLGIYAYAIFGLGVMGWWYPKPLLSSTLLLAVVLVLSTKVKREKWDKWGWGLILILVIQALVNLVGALGPELGFDALWYHLTIPRIWLSEHTIFFIPSGEFYYSGLPKLIGLLYWGGATLAKIIHWSFGILAMVMTYKTARLFGNKNASLLAAVIFYANLVVGWQSITAYIDLGRTFFEILALYLFLQKNYGQTAIILGLAMSSKILAVGSLLIFLILGLPVIYGLIPLVIISPWLIFDFLNTGNPLHPLFAGYPIAFAWTDINLLRLADPINPIFIMVLPWVIVGRDKLRPYKTLVLYCLLSFGVWYLTPRTGGGRFLLPYLPAWSVAAALVAARKKIVVIFALLIALGNLVYRGIANAKYLPVILGRQTEQEFLDKYLNKDFGKNFYYLPPDKLKSLYE